MDRQKGQTRVSSHPALTVKHHRVLRARTGSRSDKTTVLLNSEDVHYK